MAQFDPTWFNNSHSSFAYARSGSNNEGMAISAMARGLYEMDDALRDNLRGLFEEIRTIHLKLDALKTQIAQLNAHPSKTAAISRFAP